MHGPLVTDDLADHTLRARASETARDVYVFCQTFRELYVRALAKMRGHAKQFEAEVASRPGEDATPEEWQRHGERWMDATREDSLREANEQVEGRDVTSAFAVGFKALYLFVRAHQDALCGFTMLLLQPRGTDPTDYNMTRHLQRTASPVGAFIRKRFLSTRSGTSAGGRPNWVKRGTNFSIYGNWNEVGISFSTFIPEGGGIKSDASGRVGVSDVVEALDMSSRLHSAMKERAARTANALRDSLDP